MARRSIIEQVADDRKKSDQDEMRRQRMWKRIYELKNQGMDTTRLEEVVKGDVDKAAKAFSDFDGRLGQLAEIWNRLYSMDFRGFEAEYQQIYSRLRDPYAVEELNEMLDQLEKAVKEKHKVQIKAWEEEKKSREVELKKYNLKQVIMAWRSRGYKTDELEALLKKEDLDKTREALATFETDVRQLWEIGKRLNSIDYRGFENDYKEIRQLLYDTSKIEEAKTKLDLLEKKVAEGAKEKGIEWHEQMAKKQQWDAQRQKDMNKTLQEEARKAAEEKMKAEQTKEDWRRKLAEERQAVAKAKLYLNGLHAHMKEQQPEYSPLGLYLGDRKWGVEKDLDKLEVVGKITTSLFSDHLIVASHFMSAAQIPSVKDLVNYYKDHGITHRSKGQYRVDCLVMNRISEASIKAVEKFTHSNCAAFLYDIADDKIYYNKGSPGADIYAGHFTVGGTPKTLKDIFKPAEDKFEVLRKKDLGPKFGMKDDEVERMYKHLIKVNKIYPVEKRKGSFAFA